MPKFERRLMQRLTVEATPDESRRGMESLAIRLAQILHLHYHGLRHTLATRLVGAGMDLITVQHLWGMPGSR